MPATSVPNWYRARGLPPMIAVITAMDGEDQGLDHFLAERDWATRPGPAFVMIAEAGDTAGPIAPPDGLRVHMDAEPDEAWMSVYHYRGGQFPAVGRSLLMSAPWQAFASLRDEAGAPAAIARLSVGGGWAGITAVEVPPARRRQGLGTLITRAVCAEAARQGAMRLFLQTEAGNVAAQALYERCGFTYSHRYHYRIAPPASVAGRDGGHARTGAGTFAKDAQEDNGVDEREDHGSEDRHAERGKG
jgi:ribosomal protein S18 acetylase RimI-like enzyme